MITAWHLDPTDLDRYVAGLASATLEASVDAHLMNCADCRSSLTSRLEVVDPHRSARRWDEIADAIDRRPSSLAERTMVRLGIDDFSLLTLVSSRPLTRAWLASLLVTFGLALSASQLNRERIGLVLFLMVAPVLPALGTAIMYSRRAEPPGEIACVTPGRGPRLLFRRTLFVLATSIPVLVLSGMLLPGGTAAGVAWILPALALTTFTLAMSRFVDPLLTAVVVTSAWLAIIGLSATGLSRLPFEDFAQALVPLRPGTQLGSAVAAVLAACVASVGRDELVRSVR